VSPSVGAPTTIMAGDCSCSRSVEATDRFPPRLPRSSPNGKHLRRRCATPEKLRVLVEADPCEGRCEVAALLRREGIYS
jgi:hypothetical protein